MVLQREPESATIFGFEEILPGTEAILSCSLNGQALPLQYGRSRPTKIEGEWMVELPPQKGGSKCDIQIVNTEEAIALDGVLFGDVWLCSGQSNMVFNMNGIFNHSEEIEEAAEFTDIRFTVIDRVTSDVEEEELTTSVNWSDPSDANALKKFSAVCFFYAKYVYTLQEGKLNVSNENLYTYFS